ncbi:MAG: aminotransferase class I/II-fold pyridoxal phosphate-dependent enzyme [Gammaproteobacteria bacterium]
MCPPFLLDENVNMSFEQYYQQYLNQNPYPRELIKYNKNQLIDFSSNDYLGLSHHPILINRAQEFAKRYGIGAASSRSVSANLDIYEELEMQIANAMGKPAALIIGAGYQTNISVLEALLDPLVLGQEALVFCDRLCHASMLVSTRYQSRLQRFQHNDLQHLELLLEKYANSNQPKFILAESIYSMDGDQANLATLSQLAIQYGAFLYVDDAHALGVYGSHGWGKAADFANQIDMIMGTFSKGFGSFGGFVASSHTMRNYLINKCKGLIYSTAISPAILGAISAAIELVPQMQDERKKLFASANQLRSFLKEHDLNYGDSDSHIVPWIIGDASKTLHTSELLKSEGILGATIRPPSVPVGKSRIRFCLSAAHTDENLEKLMTAILKIKNSLRPFSTQNAN